MFNWLRELLDIKYEYRARKLELKRDDKHDNFVEEVCDSCETLKIQLAIANAEKKLLLEKILKEPVTEDKTVDNVKAVLPNRHLSFSARRQMLEREDRAKAKTLRQNEIENKLAAPASDSVAELERELDIDAK